MNGRLLLAVGLVVSMAALAGCTSFFGGEQDPEELSADAAYDWDTDAETTFNVSRSSFQAVVRVDNRTSLVVWDRDELGNDEPLELRAVQFRYPNGTVVTTESAGLSVTNEGQRTNITLPQSEGTVGFTAARPNAKRFATPTFAEGSHEVVLPPDARVGIPLLSQVTPNSDATSVDGETGRMTVRWETVDRNTVAVRYYLQRDILLFGGLGSVLTVVGVVGALYYLRQIRVLERKRQEFDIDVETDDDDLSDDGPPPGMR